MTKELAPIIVFAYNRPEHLKRTIESLSKCELASQSDVVVFVDGPNIYNSDDSEKGRRVQEILENVQNSNFFNTMTINISRVHKGLAVSVISGVTDIIAKEGKVIVIEDDLLLASNFIVFMNDMLDYYDMDNKIWSVTAYTPPLQVLNHLKKNVYFSYRGSSYGWGTWKDRWEKVDWDVSDYGIFCNDFLIQRSFTRGGYDLPEMLRKQMCGAIDSWAVRWCYSESHYNMMTVYPRKNMVFNIGADGSGTHSCAFEQGEITNGNKICALCSPYLNKKVLCEFRKFYKVTYNVWLKNTYHNHCLKSDKFESYFYLMNRWMSIRQRGHSVAEYFAVHGFDRIAVYGIGMIGRNFLEEIKGKHISIDYVIDKREAKDMEYRCISPSDDIPQVDVIVVTVVNEYKNIKDMLEKNYTGKIISLFDVVYDRG